MSEQPLDDWLPAFPRAMGITLTHRGPDEITATMTVRPDHGNRNGVMHGGAVMAFADALGGTAAAMNIAEDERTTTIESKTNFLRAIAIGDTITARCVPLHRGRRTTVWQTTILRPDGKPAAIVTQTQLTLSAK